MNRISRVFFFLFVSDWNFIIFQRSLFGVYSAECTSKLKVNFPWNKVNQTAILTCNNIYQIYNIEFQTEKNLKRKALCEIQMKRSVRLSMDLIFFVEPSIYIHLHPFREKNCIVCVIMFGFAIILFGAGLNKSRKMYRNFHNSENKICFDYNNNYFARICSENSFQKLSTTA